MSTYRYRDTAGDINIAANNLTAVTATITTGGFTTWTGSQINVTNLLVNAITATGATALQAVTASTVDCGAVDADTLVVESFSPIATQGMHLQWSKFADGIGYIINQKGGGTGGVKIGTSTILDAFLPGLFVQTELASATVASQVGRLDVTGNSGNGGAPAQGYSVVTTTAGCTQMMRCSAGGFSIMDFYEDVTLASRIVYNPIDNSIGLVNLLNGPTFITGQSAAPLVRKPVTGYGEILGTSNGFTGNANILRNSVFSVEWDNPLGLKTSLTLGIGHWLVNFYAFAKDVTGGTDVQCKIVLNGGDLQFFEEPIAGGKMGTVCSITIPIDILVAGTVVSLDTTAGGTGAADCIFQMWAQRIG